MNDQLTPYNAREYTTQYLRMIGENPAITDVKPIRDNWWQVWGKPDAYEVFFTFQDDKTDRQYSMTVWLTDQYNEDEDDTSLKLYGEW